LHIKFAYYCESLRYIVSSFGLVSIHTLVWASNKRWGEKARPGYEAMDACHAFRDVITQRSRSLVDFNNNI